MSPAIDADLENWSNIDADGPWRCLLVGNGASMAVWPRFQYPTLLDQAGLSDEDLLLFDALNGTRNFEVVLNGLRVSRLVCDQLQHDSDEVEERYRTIKEALIRAVNNVHVPWVSIPAQA